MKQKIDFEQYRYKYSNMKSDRHVALTHMTENYDIPIIIRQLNLIKNTKANPKARSRLESDVNFLKRSYQKNLQSQSGGVDNADIPIFVIGGKKSDFIFDLNLNPMKIRDKPCSCGNFNDRTKMMGRDKPCSCENYRDLMKMVGGTNPDSSTDDTIIDLIDLPENISSIQVFDNEENNGVSSNKIYEEHKIDDREIIFYTIDNTEKNVDQILDLDLKYLDSDQTKQVVKSKIIENEKSGNIVGIKYNEILQGYCQFKPVEQSKVKIIWFCANKSFGTPLYMFMEKYLSMRGTFTMIILSVSLQGSYAVRRLNFWNKMGFVTSGIDTKINTIFMEKNIS